jgi:hypothetical protein
MAPFIYRCPATGMKVQGWRADEESERTGEYLHDLTIAPPMSPEPPVTKATFPVRGPLHAPKPSYPAAAETALLLVAMFARRACSLVPMG